MDYFLDLVRDRHRVAAYVMIAVRQREKELESRFHVHCKISSYLNYISSTLLNILCNSISSGLWSIFKI